MTNMKSSSTADTSLHGSGDPEISGTKVEAQLQVRPIERMNEPSCHLSIYCMLILKFEIQYPFEAVP